MSAPSTRIAGHPRGCRCDGCCSKLAAYNKRRSLAIARGTWESRIDAEPVLSVLRDYHEAGWSPQQLAYGIGLSHFRVVVALGLHHTLTPPREVRASTARAVATLHRVGRLPAAMPDTTIVPAVGTVRRIQALAAIGWSIPALETRYGRFVSKSPRACITAGTARTVVMAYDDIGSNPGPSWNLMRRARTWGWAPPLAWEGIDIDDPRAQPIGFKPTRSTSEALVEDLEFIRSTSGADLDTAAQRLGVKRNTLEKACERVRVRVREASQRAEPEETS